jgi:hypothetical protein
MTSRHLSNDRTRRDCLGNNPPPVEAAERAVRPDDLVSRPFHSTSPARVLLFHWQGGVPHRVGGPSNISRYHAWRPAMQFLIQRSRLTK